MTTLIDPVRLSGLKQASYVMRCITEGQTEEKIAIALGGDVQLVAMWLSFLKHNHWMTEGNGGWSVTAKGTQWSTKTTPPSSRSVERAGRRSIPATPAPKDMPC